MFFSNETNDYLSYDRSLVKISTGMVEVLLSNGANFVRSAYKHHHFIDYFGNMPRNEKDQMG